MKAKWYCWVLSIVFFGCENKPEKLQAISVGDFSKFVEATGYITDAENFGWSFIQEDVWSFRTEEGLNWRNPLGDKQVPADDQPVTQVSFNDAMAYCEWSGETLPTYEQYWSLVPAGTITSAKKITSLRQHGLLGNVWEITQSENILMEIRLAGGSYLCEPHTCNGMDPGRVLFVDKTTANSHVGFAVLK